VLYHQCVAAVAVSRVLSRSNSNTAQLSDDSMTHRVIVTLKSEDGTYLIIASVTLNYRRCRLLIFKILFVPLAQAETRAGT
jgi:hypothetical protein